MRITNVEITDDWGMVELRPDFDCDIFVATIRSTTYIGNLAIVSGLDPEDTQAIKDGEWTALRKYLPRWEDNPLDCYVINNCELCLMPGPVRSGPEEPAILQEYSAVPISIPTIDL